MPRYLLACLLFMVLGCADHADVPVETHEGAPMTFGATDTRALLNTTADLQTAGFAVYGQYNGNYTAAGTYERITLFDNQAVTFTDNHWTYTPLKYWSQDPLHQYLFFAYAPRLTSTDAQSLRAELFTNNLSGFRGFRFRNVPFMQDAATGSDLLVATQGPATAAAFGYDKVEFNFTHALALVEIWAENDGPEGDGHKDYYIDDIKFSPATGVNYYNNYDISFPVNAAAQSYDLGVNAYFNATFNEYENGVLSKQDQLALRGVGTAQNSETTVFSGSDAHIGSRGNPTQVLQKLLVPIAIHDGTQFIVDYHKNLETTSTQKGLNFCTQLGITRFEPNRKYKIVLRVGAKFEMEVKVFVADWEDETPISDDVYNW